MTKFNVQLINNGHINIYADEMKLEESFLAAYQKGKLVAIVDVSIVLSAHLSEKAVPE